MNEMLKRIKDMHQKFAITDKHVKFTEKEKMFRISAMQEELDEYVEASTKEDELDALVDLIVFALGTAERQGMLDVFEEAFERIIIANMAKEIGPNKKRDSFALDLVKPENWDAPDLTDLVEDIAEQETLMFEEKYYD